MNKKSGFNALEFQTEIPNVSEESRTRRWPKRETNPTVQMSIRMRENKYEIFRDLCEKERRTNGDMVEVMMDFYFKHRDALEGRG
jgi:hypothetical protein